MFNKKALIAGTMLSALILSGCSSSPDSDTVNKSSNKPSATDTATSTPSASPSETAPTPDVTAPSSDPSAVGNEAACEYITIEFSTIWTPQEDDTDDQLALTVDNLEETIAAVDETIAQTSDAEFIAAMETLQGSATDFRDFIADNNGSAAEISADPEYSTLVEKFLADTSVLDTFCGAAEETITE